MRQPEPRLGPACARRGTRIGLVMCLLLLAPAAGLDAQERDQRRDTTAVPDTVKPFVISPINVTVTRSPKDVFATAAPVAVLDSALVRETTPNTAADLLKTLPGLDVNGVGTNQTRPTIRGQRGQRILLLEDGLRLNNARRQADFGELPAIVDLNAVQRVEVVRGPASVLYGTDAIGGVVNLITDETPAYAGGDVFGGQLSFVYRDEGEQYRPNLSLFGRAGRFGFRGSASYRDASDYTAPSGTFGNIVLGDDVRVNDTGVEDQNYNLAVDYNISEEHRVFAKGEYYRADDAGFGFVSNEDLGDESGVTIEIRYPEQKVQKYTLGYRGKGLGLAFADRLDVTGFFMDNEREFMLDVFIPFGPDAGLTQVNDNFTDLQSFGLRAEATKLIAGRHLLTYGFDYYRDDSENTDATLSVITGFGPPMEELDETPRVPFASYGRLGIFAQGDLTLHERVSLIVGARFQDVRSSTEDTPGLDDPTVEDIESSVQTVVAAANLLVEVLPYLNLVGTVGRGFRAPNLVELYFNGPTPEGSGFQIPNPDLEAETSLNFDVGLKYRRSNVAFEGYYFRNEVKDGITIGATGDSVGPLPSFQNVNVDKLRYQGVELFGEYAPLVGLTLGLGFSWLDSEDVNDENNPIGDAYRTKVTADLTYRDPGDRFWARYDFRYHGKQEICDPSDPGFEECRAQVIEPPIGFEVPSFNVHNLRAGVKLFQAGRVATSLGVAVENLTDELYAEFSNASFFRPQPGRTFLVSWIASF